jgi:MFS superfamily sulfate permease-like transporter
MFVTVATDLLVGVTSGVLLEILLHALNGMPLKNTFKPKVDVQHDAEHATVRVGQAAVFSNYLTIKRTLNALPSSVRHVTLDLEHTNLVDHDVMEKLHELEQDWQLTQRRLLVRGLEQHASFSEHPFAARRRRLSPLQ